MLLCFDSTFIRWVLDKRSTDWLKEKKAENGVRRHKAHTHPCKSAFIYTAHTVHAAQHTVSPTSTGPSALCILINFSAPAVEIVSTPFMWQRIRNGTYGGEGAACHLWLYQTPIHIRDIARTAGGWFAGSAHRAGVH